MKYLLDNSTINGDFYQELLKLRVNTADMILTDLPYNVTQNKWDVKLDLKEVWDLFHHVIKDSGAIILTSQQPFTTDLINSNRSTFRYCWYWKKSQSTGHLNSYKMPLRNIEDIVVFYSKLPTYNPQIIDKKPEDVRKKNKFLGTGTCYRQQKPSERKIPISKALPTQVLSFNNCQDHLHPSQKPLPLFEYLIKTYTNEDETVLDCCAGSGTTAIACINTDRKYICIEKNKEYFDIMQNRINELHMNTKY